MKKILTITGITASGKTGLGIKIAKMIGADIISVDSRQVYKGMNIGTGKDTGEANFVCVKKNSKFDIGYYKVGGIKIWLMDIILPSCKFSVSDYVKLFDETYKLITDRGRKVILVGGSGFYVDSILDPKYNFESRPMPALRRLLNILPTSIIKKIYKTIKTKDFNKLNNSEKNNRHRLIRKIEKLFEKKYDKAKKKYDGKVVCLMAEADYINKRIDKRVSERLKNGLIDEVGLLIKKYGWNAFGLNCLAYKEFKSYFENKNNFDKCVSKWKQDEHSYAKRQRTWFKKKKYKMINVEGIDFTKLAKDIVDGRIFYE